MTHSDVLEMELVLIEYRNMLDALNLHPSQGEIHSYLDRQARRDEILHLLGMLGKSGDKRKVLRYQSTGGRPTFAACTKH